MTDIKIINNDDGWVCFKCRKQFNNGDILKPDIDSDFFFLHKDCKYPLGKNYPECINCKKHIDDVNDKYPINSISDDITYHLCKNCMKHIKDGSG